MEELRKSSCVDFIGIKRIGELDRNPFLVKRTRLKLSNLETLEPNEEAWSESLKKAFELLNLWEDYLWNPSWKPFKIITVEGSSKVCISLLNSYQIPPLTHPSQHFFFFLINLFKQLIISYVCSASSIFYIDVPVQEIIDEEDEKLKALKSEYGYKVYVAVTNALTEINKYKPISRYENKELWNHREGRKATLREVVSHMLEQWRLYAQKRY